MEEIKGSWYFPKKVPGQVRRDPFEAEFFAGEEESEGEYSRTDGLVRETIQNALDAAAGSEPVRVRYAIKEVEHGQVYVADLDRNLASLNQPLPTDRVMQALVYEDFGTRGLCGEPERDEDPASDGSDGKQDFYWFWRNVGRSGKGGQDLGRWGLGKTVLPAASRINTMLGLTVRSDDHRRMLMGQAVLKFHSLEGNSYLPEEFFGKSDCEGELPMPIEEEKACDAFAETFALTRGADTPGLSVVVPHCAPNLKPKELLRSIVLHFFVPVLRGKLVAEVEGPGLSLTQVDHQSIREVASNLDWSGPIYAKKHVQPPLDFVEWALKEKPEAIERIGVGRSPEWPAVKLPEPLKTHWQDQFVKGEPVAIRVPMQILRQNGSTEDTYFDVFLQQDEQLQRGEDYYVREGMTISGIRELRSKSGVRGLVLVDDKPLSSLLGDAEGPAHTEWGTGESRPDQNYKTWKRRVSFVKNSLSKLSGLLTPPPDKIDRHLLEQIFSIEDPHEGAGSTRSKGVIGVSPKPVVDLEERKHWYQLYQPKKKPGEFHITRNRKVPLPGDARLQVAVAYDRTAGDPLANWSPFDFLFQQDGPIRFSGTGVEINKLAGNVLEVVVNDDEFKLAVRGFDRAADLYVKIYELTPSDAEAEFGGDQREILANLDT